MSSHATEAYNLSLKGATAEQIASATAVANQLDQMEQTKKIQEMNNEFMEQAYLVGMLPKEIAVYKAFLAGATAEQAKFAGSLAEQADNMEKAKEVTESNMTPLETYTKKLKELDALKASGSISQETYDRAKQKAKGEYESDALPSTPFSSAMEQGSAEARSTVLNFQAAGMMNLDDPAKETAKNTQKQVEQGDAMLGLLGKLVDKGLAKANDLADAGLGQLLGFQ
jgi:hypothetical protein